MADSATNLDGNTSAEEIEIALTRMDFYHVIATGGRAMTALGVVIATFGVARQLRS